MPAAAPYSRAGRTRGFVQILRGKFHARQHGILASSGHVTTRSMSLQHLRSESPMLTFATKKLFTGANGQKEDAHWLA